MPGAGIVALSWASNVAFAATAVPVALGADSLDTVAAAMALALFAVSLVVWVWAFGQALVRSARGDEIAVASLFFLQGSAPRSVGVHLLGSLAVSVGLAVATAKAEPFGVLVPMLPLGLAGLWAARYGVFPARPQATTTKGSSPAPEARPSGGGTARRRSPAAARSRGSVPAEHAGGRTRSRAARGRNGRGRSSQ